MFELKNNFLLLVFVVFLSMESISSQGIMLKAININTKKVQVANTPDILTVTQSRRQTSNITNTGKTLTSTTFQPNLATIYGGLLNDTYLFCQDEFYWDLTLKPDAGIKIDGVGSHVQVVLTFSNNGCDATAGSNIVQIVTFIYVFPHTPAPFYKHFNSNLQRITKAGSSTKGSEYYVCKWFFADFSNQHYYLYTAANGVTVIVVPKLPIYTAHKMSWKQFYGSFGQLRNSDGERFSHKAPITPSPQVIRFAQGLKLITTQ